MRSILAVVAHVLSPEVPSTRIMARRLWPESYRNIPHQARFLVIPSASARGLTEGQKRLSRWTGTGPRTKRGTATANRGGYPQATPTSAVYSWLKLVVNASGLHSYGCSYGSGTKEVCRVAKQVSQKNRAANCHVVAHNTVNSHSNALGASRIAYLRSRAGTRTCTFLKGRGEVLRLNLTRQVKWFCEPGSFVFASFAPSRVRHWRYLEHGLRRR